MPDEANNLLAPQSLSQNSNYLFLSYNSLDQQLIQKIQHLLSERGIATFLDRDRLTPGLPWFGALQDGINNSCAVAVFIGKEGLGSWQKREIELALQRQTKEERSDSRFPVVPVLLPQADIDKAPGFLLLNTWIDLRSGVEDMIGLDALAHVVRGEVVPTKTSVRDSLCPYRALLAFREEDARLFYGREIPANNLLTKTLTHQLVAVVGPSGSGKSSIVQAGLLPLLRRESTPSWEAVIFTPGSHPFHNLAAALVPLLETNIDKTQVLLKSGELAEIWKNGVPLEAAIKQFFTGPFKTDRLLIVLDQFEELFTLSSTAERLPFINAFLETIAATPTTLLLTLRADFYGQAISLTRELSDLIQQGLINIGPMRAEELRRSIEEPATLVRLTFESGLVNRILEHVVNQPGSLPLLEFALTELWKKREGKRLTSAAYDEIGGVYGAISKRAEDLFESLTIEQQEASMQLLTRMVRVAGPDEEGTDTRLRVKTIDLDDSMRSVAHSFVQARLLVVDRDPTTNEETIEVAHEALIRQWDRLHAMLNEDREFIIWRRRLRLKLSEWRRTGEGDDGLLLQGAALTEAKQWLKARRKELLEDEHEYIKNSSRQDPKSDTWHGQFDLTNYALIVTGATLVFVFSSVTNPHFIVLISALLIAFLLLMETSSYHLWIEALAEDVGWSTVPVSWWGAVSLRLHRTYIWIFAVLAGSWVFKVYLAPLPARDFDAFVERASIGPVPGLVILILSLLFYGALLVLEVGVHKTTEAGLDSLFRTINLAETRTKAARWLDMLLYAIITASATVFFVFSSPHNPHFAVFISQLFIAYFLFKEAEYFRQWSSSLTNVTTSTNQLSLIQVVGIRLRRSYLWIFTVLTGTWFLKVYLTPLPARDVEAAVDRATVGPIPGPLIMAFSIYFYVMVLLFTVSTKRADDKEALLGITLTEAKQWLEKATTYALFIAGITIFYVLSTPNSPGFMLQISSVLLACLLLTGGGYYRLWTRTLVKDSAASTYTSFGWKAVGLRLGRTHLLTFTLLFSAWLFNLYFAFAPAGNFVERAKVGLIPGWLSLASFTAFFMGILAFVFLAFRSEK